MQQTHIILYIYILDTITDNERTVLLKVYVQNKEYYLITETNLDGSVDVDTEFGKMYKKQILSYKREKNPISIQYMNRICNMGV